MSDQHWPSANECIMELPESSSQQGLEVWDDDDLSCVEIVILNGPSAYSRQLWRKEVQQLADVLTRWLAVHS